MFSNKSVRESEFLKALQKTTTARIGIGHVGGRYPTSAQLKFRADLAIAKDTVYRDVPVESIQKLGLLELQTIAKNRRDYLMNTTQGRKLNAESVSLLEAKAVKKPQVQIIAADGLSCEAFSANVPDMLKLLNQRLSKGGVSVGTPMFVRWARVAVLDHIGEIVKPEAALILIGERPGLGISDSLSGYFSYAPGPDQVESDRNVLSNIHGKGIPPTEAALMLADALLKILEIKASGMNVRFDFN